MNRTRIKICGITSIDDALYVASLGCDAIGLNFYPKSPRSIDIKQAQKICAALPALINKVALFVNPEQQLVYDVLNEVPVDTLQFHGTEHPDFCQQFNRSYIKALSIAVNESGISFQEKLDIYSSASSILIDSYDPINFGGSGKIFDWDLIPANFRKRIILAGGLNPENVQSAVESIRPYAVDVSSGVEQISNTGELLKRKKDYQKIVAFVEAVHLADQSQKNKE